MFKKQKHLDLIEEAISILKLVFQVGVLIIEKKLLTIFSERPK